MKFKCRKQKHSFLYRGKNLGTKSPEILKLKFSEKLFVSESMSYETLQIEYRRWQHRSARKKHSTWFFNNVVNVKQRKHGRIHKKFHLTHIENLLETDNFEEYINNASL